LKKEIAYELGKYAALYTAGVAPTSKTIPSSTKSSNSGKSEFTTGIDDTVVTEGVENILPAKALGGSTNSGVNELYASTVK
jgi:hypothetical protein